MADTVEARGQAVGIRLIGVFSLDVDGVEADEGPLGSLGKVALAYLTVERHRSVSRDELAEIVWDGRPPSTWPDALRGVVNRVRAVLEAAGLPGTGTLTSAGGCYRLCLPHGAVVDVEQSVAAVEAARGALTAGRSRQAVESARLATGLTAGEFLAGCAGEWVERQQRALGELRVDALELLSEAAVAAGDAGLAAASAADAVARQPFRESAYVRLMEAHAAAGNRAEALRTYERCRRMLAEELGVRPSPSTEAVYVRLLTEEELPSPQPGPAPRLPASITSFVGRNQAIAEIRAGMASARLLSLVGVGGVGKSRLALQVAGEASGDFEAGAWLVELAGLGDPDLVAHQVLAVLGVAEVRNEPATVTLARHLGPLHLLLVLDNCEHLIGACAALTDVLLRRCPALHVLTTSREPLDVAGETVWPVPPLTTPEPAATSERLLDYEAVRLFVDRATAVAPDLRLDHGTLAEIAVVVSQLEGIPLAVELAAAWANVLSVADIGRRLDDRFRLLVGGPRTAPARHQTLRAALDWSYELLEPAQRRFFARLGVFAGSLGLDAAVTVAGDGLGDPLALLSALVRHSMVSVAGDDRYRLLDSVRVYAVELLADDAGEARDRHSRYYTELAEAGADKILGAEQVQWLAHLRADVPNFRAALDWSFATGRYELAARLAGALGWFWTLEGMLDEAIDYLERAIAHDEVPALVRSRALWGEGLLAGSLGRLERAREAGLESVELARGAGDPIAYARGLNTLGVAEWALGDHAAAARVQDEAIAVLRPTGDLWGLGVCMALRARTALDAGDPGGEAMARAALPVARASGDRHVLGIALEQVAQLELAAGRAHAAAEAAAECLALHEAVGYTEGIVSALHVLARSVARAGDAREARLLHLRALSLATRIGHAAAMCEALEGLAMLAAADHDVDEALTLLDAAQREREARGLPLRAPDRRAVDELRRTAEQAKGASAVTAPPTETVISRLLARAAEVSG